MIESETVPTILTWAEIKAHCKRDDDRDKDYLLRLASVATTAFENETGTCSGSRTRTVTYSIDDCRDNRNTLLIPRGPVISITSVVGQSGSLAPTEYQLRKQGHVWYLHLLTTPSLPIVLTYIAGFASVPEDIKQAVLMDIDSLDNNRGITSSQAQYEYTQGRKRLISKYDVSKSLVG